jgi:hypothetical protein
MELNTFAANEIDIEQLVGGLVVYVYFAYTVMVLARRLGMSKPWLAWIPVANLYLIVKMAGKEWWWLFGFLIPIVNFFVAGYVWSEIGERLGKPWWVGVLIIVPFIGFLVPGYLVLKGEAVKPPESSTA